MEKAIADIKTVPKLCVFGGSHTVTKDFGGELIMPDYYPEIRKIVTVKASVLPDSKYIHDGELETGGTLCFSVLYIGDDQTLSCVPYVTEYSIVTSVTESDITQDCVCVESTAQDVSARPLGPRKISLKARVKSRISYDRYEAYQPMITGKDKAPLDPARRRTVEKLEKKIPCTEKKLYSLTGNAKGELMTDGLMKPVMCCGDVLINEARTDQRVLTVKGEIALSTIVQSSDGTYRTVCHSIPIEERIDGETLTKNTKVAVWGRLASASAALDDDGKTLFFEVEYDIDAHTANESFVTVTEDTYSREYEMEQTRREIKSQSLLGTATTTVPLSCEGRRKGAKTADDFPISCMAEATVDRVDVIKEKATVSLTCNFSAYIASGGEIVTEEFSTPFTIDIPLSEDKRPSEICYHAKAGVSGCNFSLQEQKLKADCKVSVSVAAFSADVISPIWEATVGEKIAKGGDECIVRVCYPEKGKRIWDIAKEYKTSTAICEKLNKKSRTDICDGTPIIIK